VVTTVSVSALPEEVLALVQQPGHPADQHDLATLGYPLTLIPESLDPSTMSGLVLVHHPAGRIVIPYTTIYDGDVLLDGFGIHWYDARPGSQDTRAIVATIQATEQQWRSLIALLP